MGPSDIISIAAVAISIISMVFTTIFSILQVKHNKNSVRPISAIKLGDYEDLLFVRIDNVGTGPLTIKKLRCSDGLTEADSLIALMPPVDQPWSTFTEPIDNWTIPVGGSVTLIEIQPKDAAVRAKLRAKLASVIISLEYTDIYHSKFCDSRHLSFFGRHI